MDLLKQLNDWYNTPLGHLLETAIKHHIATLEYQWEGVRFLQIALADHTDWFSEHTSKPPIIMNSYPGAGDICGELHALPIASHSIDLVFLPHVVEYMRQPKRFLTEINRIITMDGHVMLVGFNPFSLFGLCRLFQFSQHAPWHTHWYTPTAISHFLTELEFDIVSVASFFYRPPLRNAHLMKKCAILESVGEVFWPYPGGLYFIHARKRTLVATLQMSRPIVPALQSE